MRECGEEVKVNIAAMGYPQKELFRALFARASKACATGAYEATMRVMKSTNYN